MLTIDEARSLLPFTRATLDLELERQSTVQEQIGRELAKASRTLAQRKDDMEHAEYEQMRAASRSSEQRVTVEVKKGLARSSTSWMAARALYQQAQQEVDEWQTMLDAWVSRGFHVKALAELLTNNQNYSASVTRVDIKLPTRSQIRDAVSRAEGGMKRRSSG